MMWIQIHAKVVQGHPPPRIFFIQMVQSGALRVFQNMLLST